MILRYRRAILRDMEPGDVDRHVRWLTVETAWSDWDAPWEVLPATTPEAVRAKLAIQAERPPREPRLRMELATSDGTHVGRVNCYEVRDDRTKLAAGISVRESSSWGRGVGGDAYALWCGYLLLAHGRDTVSCETWSGNERMLRVAARLGFREVRRRVGVREVRGRRWDALRFEVDRDTLFSRREDLTAVLAHARPSPA